MNNVLVLGPDIGDGEHAGKRVLVVVGQDAGVLIVGQVDGFSHSLFVAGESGFEKILRVFQSFCQLRPGCGIDRIVHLVCHLLVRNVALVRITVV